MAVAVWLANKARSVFDDRGGMEGLKGDVERVRRALSQAGTPRQMAKRALGALRRTAGIAGHAAPPATATTARPDTRSPGMVEASAPALSGVPDDPVTEADESIVAPMPPSTRPKL